MKKKPAITVIEPSRGVIGFSLKDISKHWELLYFLVWRNIKVRYKQTVIGVVWVVIQPVAAAVIFAIIFGKFVNLPSEGQPYVVFVFCAFLPWNLFANSILKASNSLVLNRNLITKIYFPRIFIPMAIVMENLVDFFIACLIFFILIIFYKGAPVLNLPAFYTSRF